MEDRELPLVAKVGLVLLVGGVLGGGVLGGVVLGGVFLGMYFGAWA